MKKVRKYHYTMYYDFLPHEDELAENAAAGMELVTIVKTRNNPDRYHALFTYFKDVKDD